MAIIGQMNVPVF